MGDMITVLKDKVLPDLNELVISYASDLLLCQVNLEKVTTAITPNVRYD